MEFVHHSLAEIPPNLTRVSLVVDRHTLAKRRWRGTAGDGREFGFDLDEPLFHGAVFFADDQSFYVLLQEPERILEVSLTTAAIAARLAWTIGHSHLPIQIKNGSLRVADALATRRLFAREHISFRERKAVFQPLKPGQPHS